MEEIKKEYDSVTKERQEVLDELQSLKGNEIVKRYLELISNNEKLIKKQKMLYTEMKTNEYKNCEHISIISRIERDRYEGRSYKYSGCIKCGLNEAVLVSDGKFLSLENKIIYDYIMKYNMGHGVYLDVVCDLNLAKAIYSKIKERHPEIDDETAIKYFEIALDHIRHIKVSEERKENRVKRLKLNPNFKNWYAGDVCNG